MLQQSPLINSRKFQCPISNFWALHKLGAHNHFQSLIAWSRGGGTDRADGEDNSMEGVEGGPTFLFYEANFKQCIENKFFLKKKS